MKKMKCHKCDYEWDYKGRAEFYATCPSCYYKTPLQKRRKDLVVCTNCKKHYVDYHNHHISYAENITVPVCAGCHKRIHNNKKHPLYPKDKGSVK